MNSLSLEAALQVRERHIPEVVDGDELLIQLVIFELAGQYWAFKGTEIREILAGCEVFFVPGLPAALEGVIHVRGNIESVWCLNELLHLPKPEQPPKIILLAQGRHLRTGIRVDRVVDVTDIPQRRIYTPPETLPDHLRPYVKGLMEHAPQPVVVLDLEQLLSTLNVN